MASPGWVVCSGQSGMVTLPPVTAAAARKGVALERSGSMAQSRAAMGPGWTDQVAADGSASTVTPALRSMSTVMAMCGPEGTELPAWTTVMPSW